MSFKLKPLRRWLVGLFALSIIGSATQGCVDDPGTEDTPPPGGCVLKGYEDVDEDGEGDVNKPITSCDIPACNDTTTPCPEFDTEGKDCDDTNPAINTAAEELCDGLDNDCDRQIDEGFDVDGDGKRVCDGDCDDTSALVFPGAEEICDGADNNCDGQLSAAEADADSDGYTVCSDGDCDDEDVEVHPTATEITDGVDNNCNDLVDENLDVEDNDSDGYSPAAGDCNDGNSKINPAAVEHCDSVDEDCDGVTDDGAIDQKTWYIDNDGDGYGANTTYVSCQAPGDGWVTAGGDCNDNNIAINPAAAEVCNSIDDNCNGLSDDVGDVDGDGYTACTGDCNDNDADIYQRHQEVCDGKDNNCNDLVDDVGDADHDGVTICSDPPDCDDHDSSVHPGATEICDDKKDNDCSGTENDVDVDGDGHVFIYCYGDDCDDGNDTVYTGAAEVCDGLDNDCDSEIDEDLSCLVKQLVSAVTARVSFFSPLSF